MYIASAFWGCRRGIGGKQTKRTFRKYQKFSPSDRYLGDRGPGRIRLIDIIYEALSIAHSQSQKYAFQDGLHEEKPCSNKQSAARQRRSSNRHLAVEEFLNGRVLFEELW